MVLISNINHDHDRSVVIAIFLFLMNNVGGQIPLAVHPLQQVFGLKKALLMIWPGCIATCKPCHPYTHYSNSEVLDTKKIARVI